MKEEIDLRLRKVSVDRDRGWMLWAQRDDGVGNDFVDILVSSNGVGYGEG